MNEFYGYKHDVYDYGAFLYHMFTNILIFNSGYNINKKDTYIQGLELLKIIPDHYCNLIKRCRNENVEERPTFEEITNILKDDKFALE